MAIKFYTDGLADFLLGYITCALWSSTEEDGTPLDHAHGPDDVAADTLATMANDCEEFMRLCERDLRGTDLEQAGHDFWLTRNGHGAGFWDRGLGEKGDRLTKASKTFGSYDLTVENGAIIGS